MVRSFIGGFYVSFYYLEKEMNFADFAGTKGISSHDGFFFV